MAARAPRVRISERAVLALREAGAGEPVRLSIAADWEVELSVGPAAQDDFVVEIEPGALTLVLDPASARRAGGVLVDHVVMADGPSFHVDNPNAPPRVRSLGVRDLAAKRAADEALELVDVRTREELRIASIPGARRLDNDLVSELLALDRGAPLAFLCHHGIRSRAAAEQFAARGFRNVYNVEGGIEAWALEVDPDVPRY